MTKQLRNCGRAWSNHRLLRLFMLIADTACAEVKTLFLAIDKNDSRMDIRLPTPVSMTFRVTDSITERQGFSHKYRTSKQVLLDYLMDLQYFILTHSSKLNKNGILACQ